jgi:hypothetical protein
MTENKQKIINNMYPIHYLEINNSTYPINNIAKDFHLLQMLMAKGKALVHVYNSKLYKN